MQRRSQQQNRGGGEPANVENWAGRAEKVRAPRVQQALNLDRGSDNEKASKGKRAPAVTNASQDASRGRAGSSNGLRIRLHFLQ